MSVSMLAPVRISMPLVFRGNGQVCSKPAWLVCAVATVGLLLGCLVTGIRFGMWHDAGKLLALNACLYIAVLLLTSRKMLALATAIDAYIVMSTIAFVAPLLNCILALISGPLRDDMLVSFDHALGFSWLDAALWFREHPTLTYLMCHAYASIFWQAWILVLSLALVKPESGRHFTSSLSVALAITTVLFPFVPAVGGYVYHGLTAAEFPGVLMATSWNFPQVLMRAREGAIAVLDLTCYDGLIAFPSFHATTAVVLGYFWWQVPVVRYPAVVLNCAMVISTIPIGSHYLADVLGGSAVAVVSIWFMARYHRQERRTDRTQAESPRETETVRGAAAL